MPRIFAMLFLVSLSFGCQDGKENESSTESAPVSPGIDNVNGNIPDTSGAIKLNQPLPKDSSSLQDSTGN